MNLDGTQGIGAPASSRTVSNAITYTHISTDDNSVFNQIDKNTEQGTKKVVIERKTTGNVLDELGLNHMEEPSGLIKPTVIKKNDDGKTEKIYKNEDGTSTVVTSGSLFEKIKGEPYSIATYDKRGNLMKETVVEGKDPKTETTKTYDKEGKVTNEIITTTNPKTREKETVVRQYLSDGSYVETKTTKDSKGKETASPTYVYNKDGSKVDINDMTDEQYEKALETKEAFDGLGKYNFENTYEMPNHKSHQIPFLYSDDPGFLSLQEAVKTLEDC